ncbi:MAG: hypothetical protein QW478_10465 [Candidatus Micrarchaeaceae archaeon]
MFNDSPINVLNYPLPILNKMIENKIKREEAKLKEQNKQTPQKLGVRK